MSGQQRRFERTRPERKPLERNAWIARGRAMLIAEGVDKVQVIRLARRLKVSTGSFYWHFRCREELLHAIVDEWHAKTKEEWTRGLNNAGPDPGRQLSVLLDRWLDSRDEDATLETAIRYWAHSSAKAARAIKDIDEKRVALLAALYRCLGADDVTADFQARFACCVHTGYHVLRQSGPRTEPAPKAALTTMLCGQAELHVERHEIGLIPACAGAASV